MNITSLIAEFRKTMLEGENSCGFVSPVGYIKITAIGDCISEIAFSDSLCDGKACGELAVASLWLSEYFAGNNPLWSVNILDEGTEFQRKVWAVVDEIPYGKTMTYGEIGRKILKINACSDDLQAEDKENPKVAPLSKVSAQAVGGAVGRNKIAIIRPCHRVLGANASLTGYKWGLDKKAALLDFEKISEQFI